MTNFIPTRSRAGWSRSTPPPEGYLPHQVRLQGGDASSKSYCYPRSRALPRRARLCRSQDFTVSCFHKTLAEGGLEFIRADFPVAVTANQLKVDDVGNRPALPARKPKPSSEKAPRSASDRRT